MTTPTEHSPPSDAEVTALLMATEITLTPSALAILRRLVAERDQLRGELEQLQTHPLSVQDHNAGAIAAANVVLEAVAGTHRGTLSPGPLANAVAEVKQLLIEQERLYAEIRGYNPARTPEEDGLVG